MADLLHGYRFIDCAVVFEDDSSLLRVKVIRRYSDAVCEQKGTYGDSEKAFGASALEAVEAVEAVDQSVYKPRELPELRTTKTSLVTYWTDRSPEGIDRDVMRA